MGFLSDPLDIIARIHNDFPTKFGLPRQAGLAPSLYSKIVFEPSYRIAEALRGLEGFSYIWLIWGFSANEKPNEEQAASAASGRRLCRLWRLRPTHQCGNWK